MPCHWATTTYRKLVAERLVLLAVALRNGNGVVVVIVEEAVVCNVPHPSKTSTAVEQALEFRLDTRPDLDPGAVACVGHGNVVDVEVLHNVRLSLVLTERADTDSMRAVANQVLDNDVGAVGLE